MEDSYGACGGTAGYAGGLAAGNGIIDYTISLGANQSFGNVNGIGADGRKGNNLGCRAEGSGGSGGGYRGGLSSTSEFDSPGSGGSSYISGHPFVQISNHILIFISF